MTGSVYEPIEHSRLMPAKVFLTGLSRSRYHWHDDYEMVLLLKGRLTLFSGPEPVQMKAGDILLINSKSVHGYQGMDNNICLFLQFSPSLLAPLVTRDQLHHFYFNSTEASMMPKQGYSPFIRLTARVGLASQVPGQTALMRTRAWLELLLAELLDGAQYEIRREPLGQKVAPEGHLAAKIAVFIHEHYTQPDLAQVLCRRFAVSEKSLYRCTKSALGMSPKELIDKERIEQAKNRLRESGAPVALVGEQCGFSSEVTFHRVFKRETGLTPKAYRNRENGSLVGREIQGYLSFEKREALALLEKLAAENP